MSPVVALFFGVSALAVAGGLGVVLSQSVVYASLFLLLSLLAVAGIFILLLAPFLALVQVLIYGGAIVVVVLFALMLTRQGEARQDLNNRQRPLAAITALAALGVLLATVVVSKWPPTQELRPVGFTDLASTLFGTWAVPFEIASVLLLVALIGAIVIARPGEKK